MSGQGSGTASPSGLNSSGLDGFSPQLTDNLGFNASMNNLQGSLAQELGINQQQGSLNSSGSNIGGDLNNVGGIVGGIQQGGAAGYGKAALSAGALASRNGAFGANTNAANSSIGYGSNLLGAYTGFKQGGVAGDAQGVTNIAEMGARAGAFGSAADSAIGQYAPGVGAALSTYNAIKNWQSGNTGSDALNGAEAGASIGSLVGPMGTLVGGVIGGAVGAVSSAFGGGERDPETTNWNSVVSATKSDPSAIQQLAPSQLYQGLAGVMDAKDNSPGHSQPIEQVFGRMGEQNLMDQMTSQINSAIASGAISKTASPSDIYSQVVAPWLASKGASIQNNNTSSGNAEGAALQNDITGLIGAWQGGTLTDASNVGVDGQTISGLPGYAGAPSAMQQMQAANDRAKAAAFRAGVSLGPGGSVARGVSRL